MSWVKLDTSILTDEATASITPKAFRTYVRSLAYCGEHLTDGYISPRALRIIQPLDVPELIEVGLWEAVGDGYVIRHYLDHQQSREQVEAARESARRRQSKKRQPSGNVTPLSRRDISVTHGEVTEQIQIPDADEITNPTTARVGVTALPVDNCGGAIA